MGRTLQKMDGQTQTLHKQVFCQTKKIKNKKWRTKYFFEKPDVFEKNLVGITRATSLEKLSVAECEQSNLSPVGCQNCKKMLKTVRENSLRALLVQFNKKLHHAQRTGKNSTGLHFGKNRTLQINREPCVGRGWGKSPLQLPCAWKNTKKTPPRGGTLKKNDLLCGLQIVGALNSFLG